MRAKAYVTQEVASFDAGQQAGRSLLAAFSDQALSCILAHATIHHDQSAVLAGLRSVIGPRPAVAGCSTQGVMAHRKLIEEGHLLGVMGLGGSRLTAEVARVTAIDAEPYAKGRDLADRLMAAVTSPPAVVLLYFDPLCGADVGLLAAGLAEHLACPVVGGGASQTWGPLTRTFQYDGDQASSRSAVAVALSGPLAVEIALCQGTSPLGIVLTATQTAGSCLLELDGRPALDVWREMTGCDDPESVDSTVAWLLGFQPLPARPSRGAEAAVRAVMGIDAGRGALLLSAAVAQGTRLMVHHCDIEAVSRGALAMGRSLRDRLGGRRTLAAIGFESGARTAPLRGIERSNEEHLALQRASGLETEWLGMLAWGEVATAGGAVMQSSYSYPLVFLLDAEQPAASPLA